jgi:ABC-type microcin C transport system permease subunit YejE
LVSTNPDLSSDLVPLRFAFDFGACAFQSFRSSTCGSFSLWIFLVLLKAGLSWAVGSKTQVLSVLVEFFMMIS